MSRGVHGRKILTDVPGTAWAVRARTKTKRKAVETRVEIMASDGGEILYALALVGCLYEKEAKLRGCEVAKEQKKERKRGV